MKIGFGVPSNYEAEIDVWSFMPSNVHNVSFVKWYRTLGGKDATLDLCLEGV